MIYLLSGANGVGKTLFTLADVRKLQLESGRPVFYNGRFDLVADLGWTKIDAKDWETCPDGSIFLFDECQDDFPLRPQGAPVPSYVSQLAQHRKRGFDFFLITQHPQNIDVFVRRLIGHPGWHRHLKVLGPSLVSQVTWSFVNAQCEKPGGSASGEVTTRSYPKEVYGWYQSASMHTGKQRFPRAFLYMVGAFVAIPLCAYLAYRSFNSVSKPKTPPGGPGVPGTMAAGQVGPRGTLLRPLSGASAPGAKERAKWLELRSPRLPGMPQTAPLYDGLTTPAEAPYPAACLVGKGAGTTPKSSCSCWTQQGTRLETPEYLCKEIAERGFFMDWRPMQAVGGQAAPGAIAGASFGTVVTPSRSMAGKPEFPPTAVTILPAAAPAAAARSVSASVGDQVELDPQAERVGGFVRSMRAGDRRMP